MHPSSPQPHRRERKEPAPRSCVKERRAGHALRAQHLSERSLRFFNPRIGEDAKKARPVAPEREPRTFLIIRLGDGHFHAGLVMQSHIANFDYGTGSSSPARLIGAATFVIRYSRRHSSIIVNENSRCMFEKPPRCPASNCRTTRRSNRSASRPV